MRVSYKWLKTMVDVPEEPRDLVAELIRTGTEVEAIDTVGQAFDHVVTGKVLTKDPHPDSDHMWVTTVDVGAANADAEGNPQPLQIVCGAQNFNAGDHIVVAMVGAELPGGIKIKKAKLRGVESRGMNCSARELGLSGDHSGIMILPEDAPVGMPFARYADLSDSVLDCEITPNRPDCLSMIGMAREVGAILDEDLHIELPAIKQEQGAPASDVVEVEIADEGLCDRYVMRVVRNVKVGPSPQWMVERLAAAGVRSINNVVDITNYVMMLTGQPLHAFDMAAFDQADDGKRHVVVRAAHAGEKFTTLDGQERVLAEGMGLITDNGRPVALAGVMGGLNSEIEDDSTDVLIESACFAAGRTSHTSRDLDLISEASLRFERQVDVEGCVNVANITCALIEELAGGEVAPGCVEVYPAPFEPAKITLRLARVDALIGASIAPAFTRTALARLGCGVEDAASGELLVTQPSFRPDLTREIDLIEEILRLWGMGRVEATIPAAKNHVGGLTPDQRLERKIGQVLRACGLNETTTYGFAAPGDLEKIGMSEEGRGLPVKLMRPLVAEQSEMRRTLLPGLLTSVDYNEDHGNGNIQLYEMGRLFFGRPNKSQPKERMSVAAVLAGAWGDSTCNQKYRPLRFFDGKGIVEELLAQLRVEKVRFRPCDPEKYRFLQPGRAAEVLAGGTLLGWVGEVHPSAREAFDIKLPVTAFELDVDALKRAARPQGAYRGFSPYPPVEMDLAIVVDEDVTCETLEQRLRSAGGKLLSDVRLFDVYRDNERVGAGKKSMAFALTYRAEDHTLTSAEVEKVHQRLITKVCKAVGGTVRS